MSPDPLGRRGGASLPRALRLSLALGLACAAAARGQAPAPGPQASDAVVFLRVMGTLRAEFPGQSRAPIEESDVEIATGTGFLVNADGLLVTSRHVVAERRLQRRIAGAEADVTLAVDRIEASLRSTGPPQRLTASLLAEDPELDLALLSVTGAGLPFLPLGDSDAAQPGEPVRALGFPLGRAVEVARPESAQVVPRLSVSPGSLSARRDDEAGASRYLQTDATLNPGNSGGPLLDAEGYVLGVVEMKLAQASGLGFVVPVNVVKDFLERSGFLPQLPTRRLRPGPLQSLTGKGLRLRLPEGYVDGAGERVRVDARLDDGAPELVVDRLDSPWGLEALEQALAAGRGFEPALVQGAPRRREEASPGSRLLGATRGRAADGTPLGMEYAILGLGREKLVARWIGPADALAFNRSVLRESLESLEADPLLTEEVAAALEVPLAAVSTRVPGVPSARLPAGFWVSRGAGAGCEGLPEPDGALTARPAGDFTVVMRWRYWLEAPREPGAAAAACGAGNATGPAFASRFERFGVAQAREGRFLRVAGGLLGLEIEAPLDKVRFLEGLAGRWLAAPLGTAPEP